jgi:hypothetical protein
MGLLFLIVILLGLRGGFTGFTYPLTLFALALSAFGAISLLYSAVFIPLAFIHFVRLQHPLFVSPALGRTGLLPLFHLLGIILSVVMAVKVVRVVGLVPVGVVLVVAISIGAIVRKVNARRERRMLALLQSDLGVRYCGFMQRTGAICALPGPTEDKVDALCAVMNERDEIYGKIAAAGVDPAQFTHFMLTKAARGELPSAVLNL